VSTSRSKQKFTCTEDCRQEGCPGHEMEFINYHTSCTCEVKIDGKSLFIIDWARMDTILSLIKKDMEV